MFKTCEEVDAAVAAGKLKPEAAEKIKAGIERAAKKGKKGRGHRDDKNRSGKQDPAWYTKFPTLYENAANLPWNHIAGTKFTLPSVASAKFAYLEDIISIPWIPVPGKADSEASAINMASRSTWLALHRTYRGVGGYQQADVGIIMFGIMDFMVSLAEAERIYGVISKYTALNRNMPNMLLAALGVAPITSATDIPNFRYQLNRLISKAQLLCLPRGMSLLERYLGLSSAIFKDSESPKATHFAYVKPGYWYWDPTRFSTGSALSFRAYTFDSPSTNYECAVPTNVALRSLMGIIGDLQAQLDALLTDDDVVRFCSDVIAAVAKNDGASAEIVRLSPVPEDYTVEVQRRDDWTLQFHNTHFCGQLHLYDDTGGSGSIYLDRIATRLPSSVVVGTDPAGLYIYQENNVIHFNADVVPTDSNDADTWVSSRTDYGTDPDGNARIGETVTFVAARAKNFPVNHAVLDTWDLAPNKESVIDMTRNVNLGVGFNAFSNTSVTPATTAYYSELTAFGSELFFDCIYFRKVEPSLGYIYTAGVVDHAISLSTASVALSTYVPQMVARERCDWFPHTFLTDGLPSFLSPITVNNIFGEIDNVVFVNSGNIAALHDAALLSEFVYDFIKSIISPQ